MAIAFDAVNGATGIGVSSLTYAITVAVGGVLLVFAAPLGSAQTVSSVTFDGVALTVVLVLTDNSGGVAAKNSAWMSVNPTTGISKNVVVTFSAALGDSGASHAVSYTGVETSSVAAAHRTIYSGGAGGSGANLTVVDSQAGDLVIGSCANYTGGTQPSAGAGFTSRRFDTGIDGPFALGTEDISATGASTVVSFTNDDFCTNVAYALVPGSGGGATVTYPQLERGISRGVNRGVGTGIARSFVRRDRIFVPAYVVLGDLKAAA